jgi:curli biogenesis system outer membrane secretion channel CsgG
MLLVATVGLAVVTAGCASSSESAKRDVMTADVAKYPPPPPGIERPRVGVPPFQVQGTGGFAGSDVNALAADQMTTLLDHTDRFRVIERTQLEKLLDEQNLEGIVKPGELARPGQVRGVDYLLLGRVTNLRVKSERKTTGFGLAQLGNIAGGADIKKKDVVITTECGVDIRLVDPTTGELMMSNFSEFNRKDNAGALGVDILGASAQADADIQISEDDKGKILRLALNDALLKSLPKIDRFLLSNPKAGPSSGGGATGAMNAAPSGAAAPTANKKFCAQCGKEMNATAQFCPHCGAKSG